MKIQGLVSVRVAGLVLGCLVGLAGQSFGVSGGIGGGRFEVDGNLITQLPASRNDWLDGSNACVAGSGGVMSNAAPGNPKSPMIAPFFVVEHLRDGTGNNDQVFKGQSNKLSDDPSTYSWKSGSAPQKDDIGNGTFAFFLDANNKLWVAVSGDRRSVNGDSYIDYEFLQNKLTQNDDGTFETEGPDGGRTLGDVLLTIHLTNGGSVPEFFAQTWTNVAVSASFPSGFGYVTAALPPTGAFVSGNSNFTAQVCYGAFGSTTYLANAFGEGAVNLSDLLPALSSSACFHISSVFIRTKSSTSPTAELKDFIRPIEAGVCVDNIAPEATLCPSNKTVNCPAQIVFDSPTFVDNCGSAIDVSHVDTNLTAVCPEVAKVRRTWTATDECGNSAECSQTITQRDTLAPSIVSAAADTTVVCPTPATFTTPTFSDLCSSVSITVTQEFLSVTCPEVQKVRRTFRATDTCGNWVETNQTITSVSECTAPAPQPPLQ